MLKSLDVAKLKPGMLVTQVLSQSGPVKIRKVGMIRSPDMIKGLKEMGVVQVEVDLSQSLHIEDDEQVEIDDTNSEDTDTSTHTQKLVASDKQIADVDRQLSQQFHRSLFLPAVDQMPSKWDLYGKPYALLGAVVFVGLLLGWGLTYASYALLNSDTPEIALTTNNRQSNEQMTTKEETESLSQSMEKEVQDTPLEQNNLVSNQKEDAQQDSNESNTPLETVSRPEPEEAQTLAQNSRTQVNGVELEAGQQVLGYQGDEPLVEALPQANVQLPANLQQDTNADDEVLNPDLYRRIQAAAQALDNQVETQQEEPLLTVTDLNDLPRIDQLSPATLTQLPAMSFSAHMYASNPQDRWVRVNSRRLGEGDYIAEDLLLKSIESEKVVLSFNGEDFTMNALSDW